MLRACSSWVFESLPTSAFNVPSSWSNSRLRSSLTDSALRIFASISFKVSSVMPQKYSLLKIQQACLPASDARQNGLHAFPDFCADELDGAGAVHDAYAIGFGGGNGLVTPGHAHK